MAPRRLPTKGQQTFFDLPSEIRNIIYDGLRTTKYSIPLNSEDRPFVYVETVVPHARLISCQFKAEAEAQISKSATLVLKDRSGEGCGSPTHLRRPGWSWCMESVTHVEAEIHLWCESCRRRCTIARGLSHDTDWLARLATDLPKLESVGVEVYFLWSPECVETWTDVPYGTSGAPAFGVALKRLVKEVPHVRSVKAHQRFASSEDHNPTTIRGQHVESWVCWDEFNGWQTP